MTVFSFRGSKIVTDQDGQITDVLNTTVEAVTRIGTNTLDIAYLGDPQDPFAVSLSDYNLLFDTVHINDGDLPEKVEFFDYVADNGFSARVLNFVFETEFGVEELMFSTGTTSLPQFRSPAEASSFFALHEPVKVTAPQDFTIHLDQIENVETSGVFMDMSSFKSEFEIDDQFDFSVLDNKGDFEFWDADLVQTEHHVPSLGDDLGDATPDGAEDNPDHLDVEVAPDVPFSDLGEG